MSYFVDKPEKNEKKIRRMKQFIKTINLTALERKE